MPPKKAVNNEGDSGPLTDNEMRFIKAMFDNMTTKPDADWAAVASDLGLKDAKCAKERFRQISKNHGWGENGGGTGSPTKRSAANAEAEEPGTPVKKTRAVPKEKVARKEKIPRRPRAAAKTKKNYNEDDTDDAVQNSGSDGLELDEI